MKKTMLHRFGALALAAMLAMSLAVTPAMATEGDGGGGTSSAETDTVRTSTKTVNYTLKKADGSDAVGTQTLTINNVNAKATYKFFKLLNLHVETKTTDIKDQEGNVTGSSTEVVSYRYEIPSGENVPAITESLTKILTENAQFIYNKDTNPMGFEKNQSYVVFQKPTLTQNQGETNEAFEARQAKQAADEAKLMSDFADALRTAINDEDLASQFTADMKTIDVDSVKDGIQPVINGDNIVFSGLDDGYWMVTTDAGVRSIVFTNPSKTNGGMVIDNKNPAPTLTKEVWDEDDVYADAGRDILNYRICEDDECDSYWMDEDGNPQDDHVYVDETTGLRTEKGASEHAVPCHLGKYEPDNDIVVNDEAVFRIEVDVKSGARNLMVVDKLDKGLRFDGELDSVIFYPRQDNGEGKDDTFNREVYKLVDGEFDKTQKTAKIELRQRPNETADVSSYEYILLDPEELSDGKTEIKIQFNPAFLDPSTTDNDPLANVFKGDPSKISDDGGKIEIIYRAKLTANTLGETTVVKEFENSAILKYSGDPNADNDPESWIETGEAKTKTYTYQLDLLKFAQGDEKAVLPGAEFVLYRCNFNSTDKNYNGTNITIAPADKLAIDEFGEWVQAGAKGADEAGNWDAKNGDTDILDSYVDLFGVMYFKRVDEGDATKAAVYVPVVYDGFNDKTDAEQAAILQDMKTWTSRIVTPASGKVIIRGLDAGLYAFGETKAPDGYNKLEAPVMAVIGDTVIKKVTGDGDNRVETVQRGKVFVNKEDDTTKLTFKPVADDSFEVQIANASGLQMPSTGGIGTTIFYAVGGILVLGAGVLLIIKKRAGHDE